YKLGELPVSNPQNMLDESTATVAIISQISNTSKEAFIIDLAGGMPIFRNLSSASVTWAKNSGSPAGTVTLQFYASSNLTEWTTVGGGSSSNTNYLTSTANGFGNARFLRVMCRQSSSDANGTSRVSIQEITF